MKDKIIQLMPIQGSMYIVFEGEDEKGKWKIEDRIIALALWNDGDIDLVIIDSLEKTLDLIPAPPTNDGKIIFK